MPEPGKNETQDEFISRCIPIVLKEGTAKDNKQAAAICHTTWRKAKKAQEAMEMSFDEKTRLVRDAWRAKFQMREPQPSAFVDIWPREVWKDKIIIGTPKGLFAYPYTISDDGEIEFGEPVKVEMTYKVSEAVQISPRRIENEEFNGTEWDITIIGESERSPIVTIEGQEFIKSKNGRLYPLDVLEASASSWEGIRVYDNHLTNAEYKERGSMRSVAKEWIGNIVEPKWDATKRALTSIFKVVDLNLAKKLKRAWDMKILGTVGFSMDTFPQSDKSLVYEGQRLSVVEGFIKKLSVDLVAEPAAGGGFNRILAAEQPTHQEVEPMDLEAILKAMEEDEKLKAALVGALAADDDQEPPAGEGDVGAAPPEPVEPEQQPDTSDAVKALESRIILGEKLEAAKLDDKHEALVRGIYTGKTFQEAELDSTIKHAKEAQAANDPSGQPQGVGDQRTVGPVFDEADMQEVEFMRKIMWSSEFRALEGIEEDFAKERVPESYTSWIKAGRPALTAPYRLSELVLQILGGNPFDPMSRASEASTTSSLSSIVKNTVNIMLANDYANRQRWWEPIVRTEEVDTIDTETLVRVFGLANLAVVPEGNPYVEMAWVDEEETATFVKKGNYVGVTLEALLSDKVQAIRTLPNRLASSWYNTISAMVDAVFTGNSDTGPVLTTTGALFNNTAIGSTGGHANLLTTALSFSAYAASRTAMMKQTGQALGAGVKAGIRPRYLVAGVDLDGLARQITGSEKEPGTGNNEVNPYYKECEVVVNPVEDDPNNWALVADPAQFPAIWLIFLRGLRAPAIFEAGDESSGAMFTNDTLRYKVRLMTWRFSSTYDCAPVSDFRPLHKNNVA